MTDLETDGRTREKEEGGGEVDDLLQRVREAVQRTREVIATTRETLSRPVGGGDAQAGGD